MDKVLQVKNLRINFRTVNGQVQAVRGVSFDLHRGKTMAIVGESGSGKSVTSRAILGILANNSIVKGGNIYYSGQDLLKISEDDFHKIRGDKIAMIFQDPLSSLNPIVKVGKQLTEAMILKNKANRKKSRKMFNKHFDVLVKYMNMTTTNAEISNEQKSKDFNAFEFKHLELENSYNVALNNANDLLAEIDTLLFEISKNSFDNYNIIIKNIIKYAPLCKDKFFIEDISKIEQAVKSLKENYVMALKERRFEAICSNINIIKNELLAGTAKKAPNFFSLAYYLTFVNNEIPNVSIEEMDIITRERLDNDFMIEFIERTKKALIKSHEVSIVRSHEAYEELCKFKQLFNNDEQLHELSNNFKLVCKMIEESIDELDIYRTSAAYTFRSSIKELMNKYFKVDKTNANLEKEYNKQEAKYNKIIEKGKEPSWNLVPVDYWNKEEIKEDINENIDSMIEYFKHFIENKEVIDFNQRAIDIIDFFKQNASNIVNVVTKRSAKTKAIKLMEEVGIPEPYKRYKQYPFEFSGGMRQRIVIAIALAADPEILICDEPTTALDVTIQSQILELINKLKKERNLSILFITHDMGVVANMADEISVMYAGKIVEKGTVDDVFYDPRHPYTWALLSSMPDLETKEKLESIPGTPPNMIYPPKGDAFAERNKYALKIDFLEQPPMFKVSETHSAATWLLHPSAPKVEMPAILKERIDRMKKAAVNENE